MLAYMNQEAYEKTRSSGMVTFYSRSRQQLWTKGETSGNFLQLKDILVDCDRDTILVKAVPTGPVCHTGRDTCFSEQNLPADPFLFELEQIIQDRKQNPSKKSYTTQLFDRGKKKIAQKVGEEASEVIIEGIGGSSERLAEETADLLYHMLVLLAINDLSLERVLETLRRRHQKKSKRQV